MTNNQSKHGIAGRTTIDIGCGFKGGSELESSHQDAINSEGEAEGEFDTDVR